MYNFSIPEIKKNNNFHLIRLLCCLIVIYEHCCVLTNNSKLCINFRGEAVNVFFILSGFWVTISLLKVTSLKEYLRKRFFKIFPQYWFVVFFFSIFLCFFSKLTVKNYFFSIDYWKYLFANLSTLNFLKPRLPGVFIGLGANGAVNGALWTIKVEIGFYLLLPILIKIVMKKQMKGRIIILSIAYLCSIFVPIVITLFRLPSSLNNQLPTYFCYFVCGICFVLFYDELINKLKYLILPSTIIFIVGFKFKVTYLEPIVLSVIIFYFALEFPNISGWINIDYSYLMYLIHFPIIQIMNTLNFVLNFYLKFIIVLILTVLLSILIDMLFKIKKSRQK